MTGVQTCALPIYNRRFDRGNCQSDRRNIFNLTIVGQTPKFSNALVRAAATGWRLSGIYCYASGAPMTVIINDRQLNGNTGQRPNQILANAYGTGYLTGYLNLAAFSLPDIGKLGNMSRFALVGPPNFTLDTALSREFKIREHHTFEIRGEAFNLTNSLRRGTPNLNFSTTNTFGNILSAGDPRIVQFAVKYAF